MADIDDTVVEDIALLLVDCGRQFRAQADEQAKRQEGSLSLVELEDSRQYHHYFATLADACDKYREKLQVAQPSLTPAPG